MAGRAYRKLLKEKDGLGVDDHVEENDVRDESDDNVATSSASARMNAMALLMGGGDSEDSDDEAHGDDRMDGASKDSSVDARSPIDTKKDTRGCTSDIGCAGGSTPGKKKKKKKKKKGSSSESRAPGNCTERDATDLKSLADDDDATIREVQEMFHEVDADGNVLQSAAAAAPSSASSDAASTRAILAVDRRNLSPEAEMRRVFGSGAVRTTGGDRGAGRGRGAHHRTYFRKTVLATPRDTWPQMSKSGLSMTMAHAAETASDGAGSVGKTPFAFIHSKEYQKVQLKFLRAIDSLDPAQISHVLAANPTHIDSLLALSDVMKMNGDVQTAADFVERALYSFELAMHPSFNFATGDCQLDYTVYANRAFFLAIFRHLVFIGNRGCWHTAFEFSKLLLALSPNSDPLGATLLIDYYALRAGEFRWLVRLSTEWEAERQLSWLPNMAYSLAYARFQLGLTGDDDDSARAADALLLQALIRFPGVLLLLADKCEELPAFARAQSHAHFALPRVEPASSEGGVRLLETLYVERTHSLWKAPAVVQWVQTTVTTLLSLLDTQPPDVATAQGVAEAAQRRQTHYRGLPRNMERHIVISDYAPTLGLLPPTTDLNGVRAHDPLPPVGITTVYDTLAEEERRSGTHNIGAAEMFLRAMVPGFEAAVARLAAQQGRRRGGNNNAGIQAWLQDMIQAVGLPNLMEMLSVEDDGAPLAQVPDDFGID
eukprot:m.319322 g.319322  ORF g.319322 m.319322 type:complete len:715 (+) comp20301_c0_seq11:276-2420(+)